MSAKTSQPNERFTEHLIVLRRCLIKAVLSIVLIFLSLIYWAPDIFHLFAHPLLNALPQGGTMIVTDVTGSFFVPMKVTAMVAFVVALPYVLYQIWQFVAPALYQYEKRLVLPLVISSYLFFIIGMAFAYFLVFPNVFQFMVHYNAPLGVHMATDVDKYLSFAISTFLAFGLSFETPIVIVTLAYLGIVRYEALKAARRYVIVGAFVVAAIVTPPDVLSQLFLAIPLCLLFELGLILTRCLVRRRYS